MMVSLRAYHANKKELNSGQKVKTARRSFQQLQCPAFTQWCRDCSFRDGELRDKYGWSGVKVLIVFSVLRPYFFRSDAEGKAARRIVRCVIQREYNKQRTKKIHVAFLRSAPTSSLP